MLSDRELEHIATVWCHLTQTIDKARDTLDLLETVLLDATRTRHLILPDGMVLVRGTDARGARIEIRHVDDLPLPTAEEVSA